jgi:hypothetical protein
MATKARTKTPKPPSKPILAAKIPPARQAEALLTCGSSVVTAANDNPTLYPNPPYIPSLKTSLAALATAIPAAATGDVTAKAGLMATSQQTHGLILQHALWVQGLANVATPEQAVVLITTAMFHVSGVGHTTKKTVPGVINTKTSGTVQLVLLPTKGSLLHFWETSTDQKTWTLALETEHVKDKLSGLTPGQTYYFRNRTFVRGKGSSGYSQIYSLLVT